MRAPFALALVLAAASQLGASDGGCGTPPPVIRDEGFDLWCGDVLCVWKLVTPEGSIAKAATWHAQDAGVAFVASEAIIEQTSPISSEDGTCVQFDLIANVAETAEVTLDVDVSADGVIDRSERIPTSRWKPMTFLLRFSENYRGVRFQLAKRGTGAATLAQLHAELVVSTSCAGFTPIDQLPAPNGAWCATDADCTSGLCRTGDEPVSYFGARKLCVGCDAAAPCAPGSVCGRGETASPVRAIPTECVPAGGDELGALCAGDAECESGICSNGACSTCDATRPCASGTCRIAYGHGPQTCTGGARDAPCVVDEDCTSGRCEGPPRMQCADGRPCTSREQCPIDKLSLEPGACTVVGVQGGTCF